MSIGGATIAASIDNFVGITESYCAIKTMMLKYQPQGHVYENHFIHVLKGRSGTKVSFC